VPNKKESIREILKNIILAGIKKTLFNMVIKKRFIFKA